MKTYRQLSAISYQRRSLCQAVRCSVGVAHMLTSQFPGLLAFWPRYANGHAT
ncbi:hypothetical protein [Moorena producens]|uniref:hypothetical protein n=1 Tax=Moorena producens TaxID=1155739 RepID=UPI001313F634|nr:hypothetical protein [Moorena producens]